MGGTLEHCHWPVKGRSPSSRTGYYVSITGTFKLIEIYQGELVRDLVASKVAINGAGAAFSWATPVNGGREGVCWGVIRGNDNLRRESMSLLISIEANCKTIRLLRKGLARESLKRLGD
jgi:hypothetical protein